MPNIHLLPDLSVLPASPVHLPAFEQLIKNPAPHEVDFKFFANLGHRSGLFIDIGANIANSVLSIHSVNPHWEIISFEPNVSLRYFLERAQAHLERHGSKMEFYQIGLGENDGTLDFFIPKIDDWYVIGEASCVLPHFDDPTVKNRLSSYSSHGRWDLAKTTVQIRRFDDLANIAAKIANLPTISELIVKMDVEGFEASVLRGMRNLIESKRAIFMLENSGDSEVDNIFVSLGYEIFDYNEGENRLWPNSGQRGLNSFYIPSSRIASDGALQSLINYKR